MVSDLEWTQKHPVSSVIWVKSEYVHGNDYNPNSVAAPEMELLEISITEDGYTQPIVCWKISETEYEVVDGFHRHLVGVHKLKMTHLPIVCINNERSDKGDRIASTIRHNRARGKHQIAAMSEIVQELTRRNWSESKIGKQLGMEPDEVLRLKQISGLAEMFSSEEFSIAWEAE